MLCVDEKRDRPLEDVKTGVTGDCTAISEGGILILLSQKPTGFSSSPLQYMSENELFTLRT